MANCTRCRAARSQICVDRMWRSVRLCGLTVRVCPFGASSFSATRFGRVDVIEEVLCGAGTR